MNLYELRLALLSMFPDRRLCITTSDWRHVHPDGTYNCYVSYTVDIFLKDKPEIELHITNNDINMVYDACVSLHRGDGAI